MNTMRMISLTMTLALVSLGTGCGGGGGGGGGSASSGTSAPVPIQEENESNDTFDLAESLQPGIAGVGELDDPADVDFWSFEAIAGEVIAIELQAAILDQVDWAANCNSVRIEVYGPDRTLFRSHNNVFYPGRVIDLDFPHLVIESSGTHFIRLENADTTVAGDDYSIRWERAAIANLQFEVEPIGTPGLNDNQSNAELITEGTIYGYHVDQEHDFYAFEVTEASQVSVRIEAQRIGILPGEPRYYDPLIRFESSLGTVVSNDDFTSYDSGLELFVVEPGTYFIDVFEFSGSIADGRYLLSLEIDPVGAPIPVGENVDPSAAFPTVYGEVVEQAIVAGETQFYTFDAVAGDLVRLVHYSGSIHTESPTTVGFTVQDPDGDAMSVTTGFFADRFLVRESGVHTIEVLSSSDSVYAFELERVRRGAFEEEPNGSADNAATLGAGDGRAGVIAFQGDADLYRFTAPANQIVSFTIHASRSFDFGERQFNGHGSNLLPRLRVLDQNGAVLDEVFLENDSCAAPQRLTNLFATLELAFIADEAGTFFLEVTAADDTFGENHVYLLEQTKR